MSNTISSIVNPALLNVLDALVNAAKLAVGLIPNNAVDVIIIDCISAVIGELKALESKAGGAS